MKSVQFTLFGRDILLQWNFHCSRKPKHFTFRSLNFRKIEERGRTLYVAEQRIGGGYLIRVSPFGSQWHVRIYRSGKLVEIISYCTQEDVTAIMQALQDGAYEEPYK